MDKFERIKSVTKIVLLIVIISIIGMTRMWIEITEPLSTLSISVVSFYFGQKIVPTNK